MLKEELEPRPAVLPQTHSRSRWISSRSDPAFRCAFVPFWLVLLWCTLHGQMTRWLFVSWPFCTTRRSDFLAGRFGSVYTWCCEPVPRTRPGVTTIVLNRCRVPLDESYPCYPNLHESIYRTPSRERGFITAITLDLLLRA